MCRRLPGSRPITDWNAARYDRFAGPRQRAAADLLARVELPDAARITDLGCGSGLSTALLQARWPGALIHGLDSSAAMLRAARERVPAASFRQEDVSRFARGAGKEPPQDLLFANASLHWAHDHAHLFPRLLRRLRRGGVLAVQMPDNLTEPSHRLMREVAASGRFRDRLGSLGSGRDALAEAGTYYDLLARDCQAVDIWTTRYLHVLEGVDEIIAWFSSTGLKPFLDALGHAEQAHFVHSYRSRLREAYPSRGDGRVLLALPRLFIVATRG